MIYEMEDNDMYEDNVYAQSLYELMIKRKRVNPWELYATCEGIYRSIKVIGAKRTVLRYTEDGKDCYWVGEEIPITVRAVAALGAKMIYRFPDDTGRLETHYGLPTTISNILAETKIFKNITASLPCICFADLIDGLLDE